MDLWILVFLRAVGTVAVRHSAADERDGLTIALRHLASRAGHRRHITQPCDDVGGPVCHTGSERIG
jgi:hypothetical protein